MRTRILVAIPIAVLVLLAIFIQGWILVAFCIAMAILAQVEIARAFRKTERRTVESVSIAYAAVLAVLFILDWAAAPEASMHWLSADAVLAILVAASMISFVAAMFSRTHTFGGAATTIFTLVYPQLFMVCLYTMLLSQNRGISIRQNYAATALCMLMLFIPPIFSDTLAYFWGRRFGRTKLCPSISPQKTVAGSVAGVIGGCIGAFLVWWAFTAAGHAAAVALTAGPGAYVLMGAVLALISQIGDLVASYLKRSVGIKDFGHLLPGHGGVLDRIDSTMFIMPITALFVALGWIGVL